MGREGKGEENTFKPVSGAPTTEPSGGGGGNSAIKLKLLEKKGETQRVRTYTTKVGR